MHALAKTKTKNHWIFFIFTFVINGMLLWYFYDKNWFPQDDGVFAHVAQRILQGEVPNRDFIFTHPGYLNFVNALAFQMFGIKLVSLRYPLVFIFLIQSLIIFSLFIKRGALLAVVASIIPTVFSFVQFLNPNHHWYCLFFAVLIAGLLTRMHFRHPWQLIGIGFCLSTVYLFRQPTGIILAMGTLTYLFYEYSSKQKTESNLWMRVFVLIMMLGLLALFSNTADIFSFFLILLWPLSLLAWLFIKGNVNNKTIFKIIGLLSLGAFIGLIPILVYHAYHRSLDAWILDTFFRALQHLKQPFLAKELFLNYWLGGFKQLVQPKNLSNLFNGLYWVTVPLISGINGLLFFVCLLSNHFSHKKNMAIPILAIFYALVSMHYQIATYLYFTLGFSIIAMLWLISGLSKIGTKCILIVTLGLSFIAIYFHAGQSYLRDVEGEIRGERIPLMNSRGHLSNVDLWIDPYTLKAYSKLVQTIQRETSKEQSILALPYHPEIYFLAQRKNPFRFNSTDYILLTQEDVRDLIQDIKKKRPQLIIFNPHGKRNTWASEELMVYVRQNYELIEKVYIFEIYKYTN